MYSFPILALAAVAAAQSSCTLTGTVCEDHLKSCGTPTPTAVLTYGGCHPACDQVTYSPPPCPTPSCTSGISSACDTNYISCGTPVTTTLTYGGCHDACDTITYSAPSCPEPTNA
ncbi:hypothetical protein F4780DRAFT_621326 [Xylariomycetidae sp. FL0641]|nr:hypothetical protein F4780DRAFT_621326 [Xylariomycetidae sp. FL0641]